MLKEESFLAPTWNPKEIIKYRISRIDSFTCMGTQRQPIKNSYEIHLRVVGRKKNKIEIEVFYPSGFLFLLTSFQPFSSLIGKEKMLQALGGNRLNYLVRENGTIKRIKGIKSLKKSLQALIATIKNADLKKRVKKKIISDLNYIVKVKKSKVEYLDRDIELIHRFYGYTFPMNYFFDNSSKSSKEEIEQEMKSLKGKEYQFFKDLQYGYEELEFVHTSANGKELVIDEISGRNLLSVAFKDRHDLNAIRKDYLSSLFDIEKYNNIGLKQTISKYDLKEKHLRSYFHRYRMVCSTMQKIEDIKIEMIE